MSSSNGSNSSYTIYLASYSFNVRLVSTSSATVSPSRGSAVRSSYLFFNDTHSI